MIFCIEDDDAIRDLMQYALKAAGFEVMGFRESTELYARLKDTRPELIILDIMLPNEDGLSILRRLRQSAQTADIPVIMATARGTEYDKVIGLDTGADDYLVKPFGMMEMVSRIKAVLRRTGPKREEAILSEGAVVLNENRHRVEVSGKEVILTLKEYELLKLLMENAGRVFSREQLLNNIWGLDFVGETRTVDVHIGTLRTKLGAGGDLIRTVRGVGYKLEVQNEQ